VEWLEKHRFFYLSVDQVKDDFVDVGKFNSNLGDSLGGIDLPEMKLI
jgi:hypothetical protein